MTAPDPGRAEAAAGGRLALAAQALGGGVVVLGLVGAAGIRPPVDPRALGSWLLLGSLLALAAAALRAARAAAGPRRWLFLGMGLSAACSTAAQLHNVVRHVVLELRPEFPSPGLLILLLGSHPLLLLGLGGALGWRRAGVRAEAVVDSLLLVTAAAMVGIQLGYLLPWPIGDFATPAQALLLLWRSVIVAELCLAILLVVTRAQALGLVASAALAGAMVAFAAANLNHGRLALVDQAAAVSRTDVLWALALLGFAAVLRGRPGRDGAAVGDSLMVTAAGLRARVVIVAMLIAAQATLTLGLHSGRPVELAAALALFLLLLAARGVLELRRQQRRAADLAGSIAAERALSLTLEHHVAERTGELAEAQRVLQRMWVLGQHVTQQPQPASVVRSFLEAVRDVAGVEAAVLGLAQEDGYLRLTAGLGDGERLVGRLVPADESAMGHVLRTGRTWHAADVRQEPRGVRFTVLRTLYGRAGEALTGAEAVVPVQRQGATVGALALLSGVPRPWDADTLARVEAMTDLLSVALANAEAVESLRQAEWRFRTLFRAAPDAVLTLRAGGRVEAANDCAGELFAVPPAALAGRVLHELVLPEDGAALAEAVAAGLRGQAARVDVRVPRADGSVRRVEIALSRLPEAEPPTVLLIGRDVTHEHEMHERLVEAERLAAVGELVAGVAHEVNNPLGSISAFAQLLLRDGHLTPDQRESVEVVHAEAMRAAQVVTDLLAFARRSEPRREPVSLRQVVERALRLRGYQITAHGVRAELDLAGDTPPVLGDVRQLQQVVLNLVTNALQAMPNGGVLRLATRCAGDAVELEIADTGPGIPAEARAHIFEPFFTTKEEGRGTGLGLSVSYGIVAAHGGALTLAETSAEGTRFVVTLPAAPPDACGDVCGGWIGTGAGAGGSRSRSPLAGHRLLFVDDEPSLRQGMEHFGRLRDVEVVTAADGRAALTAVEATSFDAVVCDLRMPVMDGAAFYQVLCARRPALAARTLLVTGDTLREAGHFGAAGGPATLSKPFTFDQLEDAVAALLRAGHAAAHGR